MKTVEIAIEGMSCGGCVASVERVLDRLPGVVSRLVEVGRARVTYDDAAVDERALRAAVDDAGFEVRSVAPADA